MPRVAKIVIFLFFLLFWLSPTLAAESIDNFFVDIKINQDATVNVREQIDYDFGSTYRHGIYRDIPVKYQTPEGNRSIKISDITVVDELNDPYQFTTSRLGNDLRIKIGDPAKTIDGKHSYTISYTVSRAINYFEDHDELYWNVTGHGWNVPISNVGARVVLGSDVFEELTVTCFKGQFGSSQICKTAGVSQLGNEAAFADDSFSIGDGLTIVVGVSKGIIAQPSWWQDVLVIVADNIILLLPILVLIILYLIWRRYGKDPKGRGTIVTQFEAPKDLSPAQIGTIIDEKVAPRDISSEIIYLAVKGYIKIHYIDDLSFFDRFSKADNYILEKLKNGDDLPNEFQRQLMSRLFDLKFLENHQVEGKSINGVKLSALRDKFYKDLKVISDEVYKSMVDQGYFTRSPQLIKSGYSIAGGVVIFVAFFLGGIFNPLWIVSSLVSGVMIIFFGFIMPQKTKDGVLLKEHVLGLKEYLKVAEQDRIEFHNAPEKKPEVFEKLLPYAMVLRVEDKWASQFSAIYQQQPSWYSAPMSHHFGAVVLADSLDGFVDVSSKVATSTPRSASGGGSGFSGGFSGGGFGGGGGGSW